MRVDITREMVDEVARDAVRMYIIGVVAEHMQKSPNMERLIQTAVEAEVKLQAPGNPRFQEVIEGVRQHLDRFPALQDDTMLQEVVGKAIFDYLQKRY